MGAVLALLVVAGIGSAVAGIGNTPFSHLQVAQSQPAAPRQAPAQTQAPAQPAAPSLAQQALTWWDEGAQSEAAAVQGDLATISTDAGNYDVAALQTDGTQLASDAGTALADPAPGRLHGPWAKAMTDYQLSGPYLSQGMYAEGTQYMTRGAHQIERATAIVQSLFG